MKVRYDMVTVFVIRPDETGGGREALQLHRAAGDYMGETWQTVRGVAEGDEPAPQAALRELREETGLVPRELYGLSSIDSFYTAKFQTIWHCAVFASLVDRAAEVRLIAEHDAFRWVPLRDLPALLMWQRERELIAEIEREILGSGLAKPHLLIKL
jgi:dATP pyrophosphohydrolase